MKQIQKVWAEITAKKAEVALSKKKLQLSALDDVKKSKDNLERDIAMAFDYRSKYDEMLQRLAQVSDEVFSLMSDIEQAEVFLEDTRVESLGYLEEFESLANDLGVDPNDNQDFKDTAMLYTEDSADGVSELQDLYEKLDNIYRVIPD